MISVLAISYTQRMAWIRTINKDLTSNPEELFKFMAREIGVGVDNVDELFTLDTLEIERFENPFCLI